MFWAVQLDTRHVFCSSYMVRCDKHSVLVCRTVVKHQEEACEHDDNGNNQKNNEVLSVSCPITEDDKLSSCLIGLDDYCVDLG